MSPQETIDSRFKENFSFLFILFYLKENGAVDEQRLIKSCDHLGLPAKTVSGFIKQLYDAKLILAISKRINFLRYEYSYQISSRGLEILQYFVEKYYLPLQTLIDSKK